jgi:hypothetical protein
MTGLTFHHLGVAVRKPQDAVKFLSLLGYRMGDPFFDVHQKVNLIMGTHDTQPAVEIIYPGLESSPIDQLIQKHHEGIIYHVCYVTDNLENTLAQFMAAELRVLCVSQPKPAPFFPGRKASFYNVVGIGLIEILE